MAGLGAGLGRTATCRPATMERALAELRRFRLLIDQFRIDQVHVVATAAVRDARNGADFVRQIRNIGLPAEVLAGEEEARLAGDGVISSIIDADGIVGDLGGGSLELVDVAGGATGTAFSLPLGALARRGGCRGRARRAQAAALGASRIMACGPRPAAVRSIWSAARGARLAKAHMILTDYPLKVAHEYALPPADLARLGKFAASDDPRLAKDIPPLRLASLPVAAMLAKLLVEELEPSAILISAFGIREGLLYSLLSRKVRRLDPLIAALDDSGHHDFEAFADGFVLDRWIEDLFDDAPQVARIRLAACLIAASAGKAAGPFRAERAIEAALHGSWPGIDAPARVVLAQALRSTFGRTKPINPRLAGLCSEEELVRAHEWGLALRLALRFSGGASPILKTSRLIHDGSSLRLLVPPSKAALVTEVVQRRLLELGDALGLGAVIAAA